MRRREFLHRVLGATVALPLLSCGSKTGTPRVERTGGVPVRRPRYLVVIAPQGGPDAMLGSDPKREADVDAAVKIPYAPSDVIEVGGHVYGPHLSPLQRWLPELAFINNVDCSTVQHTTELAQAPRLRRHTQHSAPYITDLVGRHVDGVGIESVNFGSQLMPTNAALDCTRAPFDVASHNDLCTDLFAQAPDDLVAAADGLEFLAARRSADDELRERAQRSGRLMRALAAAQRRDPFRERDWGPYPPERGAWGGPIGGSVAVDLQMILWMIEHDIASGFYLQPHSFTWDSHNDNTWWQSIVTPLLNGLLAQFFDELHRRRNAHGALADNTVVVYGTSIGRFPFLNTNLGKDHFPEAPYAVFGPGLARGKVFGASGRRMEGLAVDLATGKPDAKGRRLGLEDLGATVLAQFGIEPTQFGYSGNQLGFLAG